MIYKITIASKKVIIAVIQQLSPRQLRAARALLNWSRATLAEHTGVSELTIHRIENELNKPGQSTQDKLRTALDENGIEFIDNDGVKFKPQGVEVLIGNDGLRQFFNNVYEYMRKYGGTIVQIGIREGQLVEYAGIEYAENHKMRMGELVKKRKDIKVLAIIREGDTDLMFSNYNQYRWISKDIFSPVPFYVYGETLGIMDYQTIPAPTIIVLKFPAITQAYRKQFDVFWKISQEPCLPEKSKSLQKPR